MSPIHAHSTLTDKRSKLMWAEGGWVADLNGAATARADKTVAGAGLRRGGSVDGGVVGVLHVGFAVHGEVGEFISQGVFVAEVVVDFGMVELMEKELGFVIEEAEIGIFDAVFSAHLFDDQLAIAADEDFSGSEFFGLLECENEGLIFGDVVSGVAYESAEGDQRRAVGGAKDNADACWPGIAATAAVEFKGDELVNDVWGGWGHW
jgi:hypothetical protein